MHGGVREGVTSMAQDGTQRADVRPGRPCRDAVAAGTRRASFVLVVHTPFRVDGMPSSDLRSCSADSPSGACARTHRVLLGRSAVEELCQGGRAGAGK